jgi:hypothetical protein
MDDYINIAVLKTLNYSFITVCVFKVAKPLLEQASN